MPRDLEPSLNTRNFTLAALQKELRLDLRPLTHTRPLSLSFGEQPGNAFVQLGKTKSSPEKAPRTPSLVAYRAID
jgi:exosome complex RNA-binding protein Rrp42 (RNase PH superfamily)